MKEILENVKVFASRWCQHRRQGCDNTSMFSSKTAKLIKDRKLFKLMSQSNLSLHYVQINTMFSWNTIKETEVVVI